jgi:hypothetical protein
MIATLATNKNPWKKKTLQSIALGTVGLSKKARGSRRRRRRGWRSGGRTVTQEADGSAGVHSGGREDMLTKLHTQSSFPFPCKLFSSVEKRQSPQQPRTGMSSWTERLLSLRPKLSRHCQGMMQATDGSYARLSRVTEASCLLLFSAHLLKIDSLNCL